MKWINESPCYELRGQLSCYYGSNKFKKETELEKIGQKEKIIEELKNIFNGYRNMTDSIESKLKKLGFSVDKSSPHYKLHFTSYPQISFHLPASGSDNRGGKNCVSDIKKTLL